MNDIISIRMPKWGLAMEEGTVVRWCKTPGQRFSAGDDLVEIETTKITNVYEAPVSSVLRRIVCPVGNTQPIGSLIAVAAEEHVPDDEIDQFVKTFQASFDPKSQSDEEAQALSLHSIDLGSRSVRVGVANLSDQAIVLLHGFSSDLNSWLYNIESLKEVASLVAIDLPGHGASTKDVEDGSLSVLARDVGRVLERLGVRRAHLVGHSLGAAVALQLAIDRPLMVGSLALIAPAGVFGARVNRDFLDIIVNARRPREFVPALHMLFADVALVSREMTEDMAKSKRIDGATEALATIRDRILEGSTFAALSSGRAQLPPGLVIVGEEDRVVRKVSLSALPAGWQTVSIEAAGHVPHIEKPTAVNEALKQFLVSRIESSDAT